MSPAPSKVAPVAMAALRALAARGANQDFVAVSSGALAEELGCSQQTASRRILDLVEAGLVQRRLAARGQHVRLTPRGLDALRRDLEQLRGVLEKGPARVRMQGRVQTGLGEGGWYISRRGYREAMRRLLGFEPYPGTLNLALDDAGREQLEGLRARPGLLVEEFQDEGRTFGAVKCFRASLRGLDAAAVLPLRGHHEGVLEVVAPLRLREKLGLRDGDVVVIEVEA